MHGIFSCISLVGQQQTLHLAHSVQGFVAPLVKSVFVTEAKQNFYNLQKEFDILIFISKACKDRKEDFRTQPNSLRKFEEKSSHS